MSNSSQQRLASAYARLLDDILGNEGAAEDSATPAPLGELAIQELWDAGLLGNLGATRNHGPLKILDHGVWNRSPGPDFLSAEIELQGKRLRGDIEIDPCAQDWERHGHGDNVNFNNVVLHVVLSPPPEGWYTRNEQHMEVPVFYLPPERIRAAMNMAPPLDREQACLCRAPLARASVGHIQSLLQAAAAHRASCKRKRFYRKAEVLGMSQAWYEAWAEALGYSANKIAMVALARRAPLKSLGKEAEALLLGTAGFLVPMLPDSATREARYYHRALWDTWWLHKEPFALGDSRALPWTFSNIRPMNHPHRRVAALAVSAQQWHTLVPLLGKLNHIDEVTQRLSSLNHPFWDFHCTFNAQPFSRRTALVGHERVNDFMVNIAYAMDDSPAAWEAYLRLTETTPAPSRIRHTADYLFGDRNDLAQLLKHHYARQGLLQIEADFYSDSTCRDCLFPQQLAQWMQDE